MSTPNAKTPLQTVQEQVRLGTVMGPPKFFDALDALAAELEELRYELDGGRHEGDKGLRREYAHATEIAAIWKDERDAAQQNVKWHSERLARLSGEYVAREARLDKALAIAKDYEKLMRCSGMTALARKIARAIAEIKGET